MRSRTYAQYCGLARALDIVGERWALLVVRELLDGPKRYTDLLSGIPGIATDMLAARLKSLEESEIVARRVLPPPAASTVYELTPAGRTLEPAVQELARWGIRQLGRKRGEAFRIHWLSLPLRMMFRPEVADGPPLVVQFETGGEAMHARIADGALETYNGAASAPDVVIAGDVATFTQAATNSEAAAEARAKGKLRITGKKEDIIRAMDAFGLPGKKR
ncbi:MAG: winged helix-turn-helix transcriptional regulator [Thermoanaerobaculia bacterium]